MDDNQNEALALFPISGATRKIRKHNKAFGKMHIKPVGSHASAPDVKLRQYAEAHIVTARWCGIKVIIRDNIKSNDEAARNCAILASEEASAIKPNLYTQDDLEITELSMEMREAGLDPNFHYTV